MSEHAWGTAGPLPPSNSALLRVASGALLIGSLGMGAWAFAWEPASLRVREHRLELPDCPAALRGLEIALLADLHTGSPWNGVEKLDEIVSRTNAAAPDIVLLAGDFVIHGVLGGSFVPPERAAERLAALSAPLGVHAVLGNHDHWLDAERVSRALEDRGIELLEDRSRRLDGPQGSFWLAGVSDFREGRHDLRGAIEPVPPGAPLLLFTHNPDLFPKVPDSVTLTLAGHTHGGQVALPGLGRPIVPSLYGERFAIGHVVEGGRHLFVSPGLGTSILPVRFRVPPEISILELRSD